MKVLISGSHGLVGSALSQSLTSEKHDVFSLVRHAARSGYPEIEWSPDRYSIALSRLEEFDSVVHLAGESIAEGRWNEEKKRRIRESRIKGTRLLSESLAQLSHPPKNFLCASAVGYYGNRGDEVLTEVSAPGKDFLAEVCVEWEKVTEGAAQKGIRTVNLRFGVILDSERGALAKMLTPFRMGVGGKVGSGKQFMSWIALGDAVGAIKFALTNEMISGPVNIVAPNPVRNAEFTNALGKVLSRPTLFPIPAFGVQLVFGEMADALLLSSQRVRPQRLQEAGYQFAFTEIESALRHLLAKSKLGRVSD